MLSDLEISQCIATKLCHDLAGTMGAINSGIDFIVSDNIEMRNKAIDLIKSSSDQSINRLVFFRHAYGIAKYNGEADLESLKKITKDFLNDSKVTLDFHEKYFHISGIFISNNLGKLILCIIQQAYSNLIHGGKILVKIEKQHEKNFIEISGIGNSPKVDKEKDEILNGFFDKYELNTNNCTSFFAAKLSQVLAVKVITNTEEKDKVIYKIEF